MQEQAEGVATLPVTSAQFESLVNEMLARLNELSNPEFFEARFIAQVVTSAIREIDPKKSTFNKNAFLEICIGKVSRHVSFSHCQAIEAQLAEELANKSQAKAESGEPTLAAVPDMPTEH